MSFKDKMQGEERQIAVTALAALIYANKVSLQDLQGNMPYVKAEAYRAFAAAEIFIDVAIERAEK